MINISYCCRKLWFIDPIILLIWTCQWRNLTNHNLSKAKSLNIYTIIISIMVIKYFAALKLTFITMWKRYFCNIMYYLNLTRTPWVGLRSIPTSVVPSGPSWLVGNLTYSHKTGTSRILPYKIKNAVCANVKYNRYFH